MKFRNIILFTILSMALAACTFTLAEDVTPPPNYKSPTPPPTVGPLFPAAAPNLDDGQAIYTEKCLPCHGDKGYGDGPQNEQLPVSVAPIGMADTVRTVPPSDWYLVVTRGNIDRFMPPFSSLDEQQRWDVLGYVYSLSIDPSDMETGAALYAQNCAECHGLNGEGGTAGSLTDQAYMAKTSNQDIYLAITTGSSNGMPAFKDSITEADRWALASYVRSLSFDHSEVAAAAPTQTSMPEPATAAPTLGSTSEGTPASESPTPGTQPTEGVTAEATPTSGEQAAQSGTITGQIVNGSGGDVPADLSITLHGYDPDMTSGNFTESLTQDYAVGTDDTYTIENVDLTPNRAYVISVTVNGIDYSSDPVFVNDLLNQGTESQVVMQIPVTIYNTSTDASVLSIDRMHIFLDFTTPGLVQVVEVYIMSNPTTNAIVPTASGEPTVTYSLPEGATGLQFETGGIGDPYVLTGGGFGDLTPVLPGQGEHQVVVAFNLPYDKSLDFVQKVIFPTDAVILMSPEGTKVSSNSLTPGETRDYQGTPYVLYNGGAINVGGQFHMTVSGQPTTASSGTSDNKRSLLIGAGALGLVLILLGAYLFWRDRQTGEEADEDELEPAIETSEDAMDAIIALDDQFRAGAISEEIYKQRRAELKERLKALL